VDNLGGVDVTGQSTGSGTGFDYATIKYNTSDGSEAWSGAARYDGPGSGDDAAYAIAVDNVGDVYVTGESYGICGDDHAYATVKYNSSDGGIAWPLLLNGAARYNGSVDTDDGARAIAVDNVGGVYVTGQSTGLGTGFDYATIKYNASDGSEAWPGRAARYDGGNSYDLSLAIALDNNGGVYITGLSQSRTTYPYNFDPYYFDYATIKYNASDGGESWVKRYDGGHGSDAASAIVVDDNGAYVTGYSSGAGSSTDYATIRYDLSTGSVLGFARYNSPGNDADVGVSIAAGPSGNVCVTGYGTSAFTLTDVVTIMYRSGVPDMGAARIDAPVGVVPPGPLVPKATVHNSGGVQAAFTATFVIDCDPPYSCTKSYPDGIPAGTNLVVEFDEWTATEGYYTAVCWTETEGDENPVNDLDSVKFTVVASGWSARTSLPTAPSGGMEGLGGWLAYDAASELVYAAKGENTGDFYAFNPVTNAWEERASIPPYELYHGPNRVLVLPGAGCRGVSDGNGRIYMTLGNRTPKFLSYTSSEGWTWLTDVPTSVFRGTDAAFVNGSVYLLSGRNAWFYRYTIATNSWADLGALPDPGLVGWTEGSWLVFDGDHTLYAQQALTEQFWAYDLSAATPAWVPLPGMPQGGTSYAGTGSAGTLLDGVFYALKGNNTKEFWQCVPGTPPAWTRLEDILARVQAGGDICANENMLFAFSGLSTNQFWRYVRPSGGPGDGAGAKTALLPTEFALSVAPNPMRLGSAIKYAVPTATNVSLKLYDISGALAKTVSNGRVQPGRYTANLSAKGLARGVYILKLQSDVCSLTRKVVIQ